MLDRRWNLLADCLVKGGWYWQEDTLYAPLGSIWFTPATGWPSDLEDFREQMKERRERGAREAEALAEYSEDLMKAVRDLDSLLACLDALLVSG